MTEEDAIAEATVFLEERGFSVERIPSNRFLKRPDLAIKCASESYLVEQKTKGDNPQELREEHEQYKDEQTYSLAKSLKPRSVFSGILKDALEQIESHPEAPTSFKVVWMTTWGVWRQANFDCLFKGLYGSQHVFDPENHDGQMRDCYYLGFADFKRFTEIDAVIVVDGESLHMSVNEFSPRYNQFMISNLVRVCGSGVHDPRRLVASGDAYSLADYDGDRSNQEKCLTELSLRLGVQRMLVMPMSEIHVVANMPWPLRKLFDSREKLPGQRF